MQCKVDMRIENKTIYQFTIYIYSVSLQDQCIQKGKVLYLIYFSLICCVLVFHILCISTQSFSKEVNTCLHAAEGTPLIKRSWGVLGL